MEFDFHNLDPMITFTKKVYRRITEQLENMQENTSRPAILFKPFDQRKQVANEMKKKYPDRIPLIAIAVGELGILSSQYLPLRSQSFSQVIHSIRQKMTNLRQTDTVLSMIGQSLIPTYLTLDEVYENYAEDDGLLYVQFIKESTFG